MDNKVDKPRNFMSRLLIKPSAKKETSVKKETGKQSKQPSSKKGYAASDGMDGRAHSEPSAESEAVLEALRRVVPGGSFDDDGERVVALVRDPRSTQDVNAHFDAHYGSHNDRPTVQQALRRPKAVFAEDPIKDTKHYPVATQQQMEQADKAGMPVLFKKAYEGALPFVVWKSGHIFEGMFDKESKPLMGTLYTPVGQKFAVNWNKGKISYAKDEAGKMHPLTNFKDITALTLKIEK